MVVHVSVSSIQHNFFVEYAYTACIIPRIYTFSVPIFCDSERCWSPYYVVEYRVSFRTSLKLKAIVQDLLRQYRLAYNYTVIFVTGTDKKKLHSLKKLCLWGFILYWNRNVYYKNITCTDLIFSLIFTIFNLITVCSGTNFTCPEGAPKKNNERCLERYFCSLKLLGAAELEN